MSTKKNKYKRMVQRTTHQVSSKEDVHILKVKRIRTNVCFCVDKQRMVWYNPIQFPTLTEEAVKSPACTLQNNGFIQYSVVCMQKNGGFFSVPD